MRSCSNQSKGHSGCDAPDLTEGSNRIFSVGNNGEQCEFFEGRNVSSSEALPAIGAVVLAGGKATRLSGKCFEMLGGKELIVHVFEKVSTTVSKIVIVTKSTQDISRVHARLPRAEVIFDEAPEQNPLVGLLSGFHELQNPYVFVAACDMPFLEPGIIRSLATIAWGQDGAVPYSNGQFEPLCAVYNRESAIQSINTCLPKANVSVNGMLSGLKHLVRVDKEDLRRYDPELLTFFNINNEDDLNKARQIMATR